MSKIRITGTELRDIERVANDFDEWASKRKETVERIAAGVVVSLSQQLVHKGHSREYIMQLLECAVTDAANPSNAAVFVDETPKGSA